MNLSELENNGYTPYSNRKVAAIAESKSGAFFPGVRIENISFPLTISAIQSALFCCMSEGETPETLYINPSLEHPSIAYWKDEYSLETVDINQLSNIEFYAVLKTIDDIPSTLQELLEHEFAHHSNFPVSALLETADGFITGINIECEDWSHGLCAERVALAKAISYGITDFTALHICTRDGEYSSPCGACRQVIIEHLPHHPVHLYQTDGTTARHFSSDLLPYSFQSSLLKNKNN